MELGKLLAFAAAVSPALFTSFAVAIVAWIVAWVFAGVAAAQPKPSEEIDDEAIARSIRKGRR
jgi:hypothetical protein